MKTSTVLLIAAGIGAAAYFYARAQTPPAQRAPTLLEQIGGLASSLATTGTMTIKAFSSSEEPYYVGGGTTIGEFTPANAAEGGLEL